MNWDLLTVAVLAGAANWAFRALPVITRSDRMAAGGWLERFLSATGPAAIATLFVAAILPALTPDVRALAPVIVGTLAVLGLYAARRSVVLAMLAGAVAHGLATWALG
ncbi:AzlD domain-containing protein [Rhodobacter sp. SY28-1]|uniref:AzlD domain-containing protein n=1 Tax=Rhodobacter sp. SY28-1 TaxID=2562317 RepID=UPI0010C11BA5|nr:AzlD domain-containing protein [Rhodobacter sp. SY28-1]